MGYTVYPEVGREIQKAQKRKSRRVLIASINMKFHPT